jgi:hypothetical protein
MRPPTQRIPRFYDYLRFVDLRQPSGPSEVLRVLGMSRDESKNPSEGASLRRTLDVAKSDLGATDALLEPYTSTDWADEYQAWYSRIFRDVPRRTTRIHFFSTKLSQSIGRYRFALGQLVERGLVRYLGYAIVRPFPKYTLGDTVLAFPNLPAPARGVDPVYGVPACIAEFSAHFHGYRWTVRGAPFFQQDQTVSVCSEADLWMIGRYMQARGEGRRFRPSDMERFAARTHVVGPTRDGLSPAEVSGALKAMDLNPDTVPNDDAIKTLGLITAYVTSGIPVMLAVGRDEDQPEHVVTALACRYRGPERPDLAQLRGDTNPQEPPSAVTHLDSIIVHDDMTGPYCEWTVKLDPPSRGQLILGDHFVFFSYVPVPERVHLREGDVRKFARELLANPPRQKGRAPVWETGETSRLCVRLYLRRNDHFAADAHRVSERVASEPTHVKGMNWGLPFYWHMLLPHYLWVVELAEESGAAYADASKRRLVGEILFDSTAHPHSPTGALLSFRLNGKMMFRKNIYELGIRPEAPRYMARGRHNVSHVRRMDNFWLTTGLSHDYPPFLS